MARNRCGIVIAMIMMTVCIMRNMIIRMDDAIASEYVSYYHAVKISAKNRDEETGQR